MQRKQDLKSSARGSKFYRNVKFRLVTGLEHDSDVPTTSALQLRAWRIWWNDKADAFRRGVVPDWISPDRGAKALAKYADDPDWNGREFQPIFRKWTTVRICTTGSGGWWNADGKSLEMLGIRTRMNTINRELIRRNMATHGDVAAMTGHLLSHYAELGDAVTKNDD
jgi:hypothetical protein